MIPLSFRSNLLRGMQLNVRPSWRLIVAFSALVGAAGCNTQSLVTSDGGAPRTASGGSTGVGNRTGGTAAETGTDGGTGGSIGAGGSGGAISMTGAGGAIGPRGA